MWAWMLLQGPESAWDRSCQRCDRHSAPPPGENCGPEALMGTAGPSQWDVARGTVGSRKPLPVGLALTIYQPLLRGLPYVPGCLRLFGECLTQWWKLFPEQEAERASGSPAPPRVCREHTHGLPQGPDPGHTVTARVGVPLPLGGFSPLEQTQFSSRSIRHSPAWSAWPLS